MIQTAQKQTQKKPLTLAEKQAVLAEIVRVARGQVGVEETPRGSNWGNVVRAYLDAVGIESPASWCMAFACWSVRGAYTRRGLRTGDSPVIMTGGCAAQADHARTHGTLIAAGAVADGSAHVLPGYLVVVWEESDGDWNYHHTGVVEVAPDGTGVFHTIEGNTNHSGARQGYGVLRQARNLHDRAGDGHPKYAFVMTA